MTNFFKNNGKERKDKNEQKYYGNVININMDSLKINNSF